MCFYFDPGYPAGGCLCQELPGQHADGVLQQIPHSDNLFSKCPFDSILIFIFSQYLSTCNFHSSEPSTMKKIFPFVCLVIFLACCMVSCGKKEAKKKSVASQTLEERYPGWANLTWISTDDNSRGFPRMEISIRENVVTIRQHTSDTVFVSHEYTMMYLLGNTLTLEG